MDKNSNQERNNFLRQKFVTIIFVACWQRILYYILNFIKMYILTSLESSKFQ